MSFEPIGGYPGIIKKTKEINEKSALETRGFVGTTLNVKEILNKKASNKFVVLEGNEEDGGDPLYNTPASFDKYHFKDKVIH